VRGAETPAPPWRSAPALREPTLGYAPCLRRQDGYDFSSVNAVDKMTEHDDRDLVLFLGAGFSWDARLPLMSQFGSGSVATQPGVPGNVRSHKAGEMILGAMQTYQAFQRLCAETGLLERRDWENVEEVFGVAESLKYSGVETVDLAGERVHIEELIARIKIWIWKTYQQLPVMRGERRPEALANREPYQVLFDTLRDLDLSRQTTIITTNYDIVSEYFGFRSGVPIHYPFDWSSSFGVTTSTRHFVEKPDGQKQGPTLCKLHGSVNFFQDATGSIGVAADLGDGVERVGNTGGSRFKNEPTIAMYDAIWKIREDHPGWLPAIVPPSYAKLEETPWLSATWNRARAALSTAKTVIFVGYSLPPTDGFMRALLVGAQMLRHDGSRPRVVVIDTSPSVRRKYRDLFHTIEPRIRMDFSRAMKKVMPRLLDEVANE